MAGYLWPDPLENIERGQRFVSGLFDQRARLQAGTAAAGGDYQGAAGLLTGRGLYAEAAPLMDETDRRQKQDRTRRALGALKAKDYGAVRDIGIEGADAATYGMAEDAEADEKKERLGFLVSAAQSLTRVPPAARKQELVTRILPVLQRMNPDADLSEIANLPDEQLTDEALAVFGANLQQEAWELATVGNSRVATNPRTLETRELFRSPEKPESYKPEWKEITRADGSTEWIDLNAEGGPPPGREAPGTSGGGSFEDVIPALLKREGGYVASDGRSGAPANFGINQRANPDIDVRNLTRGQAAQLYKDRYWNAIDADRLPPDAREAVFDFAVNAGPQRAKDFWRRADGDLDKFDALRLAHYRSLPDYAQNGRSWERRVAETGARRVRGSAPKMEERWEAREGGYLENTRTGDRKADPASRQAQSAAKITDGMRLTADYAQRMLGSNETMNGLAERGILKPSLAARITEQNGVARLVAQNPADAQFYQAAREWIMAKLRKESGAAIGVEELANDMQTYFPEPQDGAAVIRQKADARRRVMLGFLKQGRPAYEEAFGSIPREIRTVVPVLNAGGARAPGRGPRTGPARSVAANRRGAAVQRVDMDGNPVQ